MADNCIPDVTVGRSIPLEAGQKPTNLSLPVTLPSDQTPIATFDAFSVAGELTTDLLGNKRTGSPLLLLAAVRRYGIDPKVWATRVDGNAQGKVSFDSAKSAAKLTIQNGNFERTYSSLQTKVNFPYQPGRSMDTSFGVQTSRGVANANVVIEYGAFDSKDGYGFRIMYEDGKDKLLVFRRTSSGETVGLLGREDIPYLAGHSDLMDVNAYEEIIEISNGTASGYTVATNGNRLDGSLEGAVDVNGNLTPAGHRLSLFTDGEVESNLTMYRIRYSWYGASGGDFWAFVPLNRTPKPGIPRWVRMQSIAIGDTLPFPSMGNPDKPLTFRIYRRADRDAADQIPSSSAFLSTFGTSFSIDSGDPTPMEIFSASSDNVSLNSTSLIPILGIQIKPYITSTNETVSGVTVNTPNQLRAYPLSLGISSSGLVAVSLVKNPTITGGAFPLPNSGDLSAVSQASVLGTFTPGTGKVISTFFGGENDGQHLKLDDIFSYNREYLSREAQSAESDPGDSLFVMARSVVPPFVISSISLSGTIATATAILGHGLKSGDTVTISGATPGGYNGTFSVNVLSATQFTYTVASGLAAATGSVTGKINASVSVSLTWGQQ